MAAVADRASARSLRMDDVDAYLKTQQDQQQRPRGAARQRDVPQRLPHTVRPDPLDIADGIDTGQQEARYAIAGAVICLAGCDIARGQVVYEAYPRTIPVAVIARAGETPRQTDRGANRRAVAALVEPAPAAAAIEIPALPPQRTARLVSGWKPRVKKAARPTVLAARPAARASAQSVRPAAIAVAKPKIIAVPVARPAPAQPYVPPRRRPQLAQLADRPHWTQLVFETSLR